MANVRKLNGVWQFTSEQALEDFVWDRLPQLLDLEPLERQYFPTSQNRCDILARGDRGQLVVLELKVGTDDGIISQLTRYYHALQGERPFQEVIDYNLPLRLIALAPEFHDSNFIDIQYSRLSFELLRYELENAGEQPYFRLYEYPRNEELSAQVVPVEVEEEEEIDAPPRGLKKLLDNCSDRERQGFLAMRRKILLFDRRIREENKNGVIAYSRGKRLPLAEFRFDEKRQRVFPYLYLPFFKRRGRKKFWVDSGDISVERSKIWTDGEVVNHIGYMPKRNKKLITYDEWISGEFELSKQALNSLQGYRSLSWSRSGDEKLKDRTFREQLIKKWFNPKLYILGLAIPIKVYCRFLEERQLVESPTEYTSLDRLVDLALQEFDKKARS